MGVQEVRWDKGSTVRAGDYNFFYRKGNKTINWGQEFLYTTALYQQLSLLAIGCHIILRGCWCNIIVRNVRALSEEKSGDSRDSFYGELEQVFEHFP